MQHLCKTIHLFYITGAEVFTSHAWTQQLAASGDIYYSCRWASEAYGIHSKQMALKSVSPSHSILSLVEMLYMRLCKFCIY